METFVYAVHLAFFQTQHFVLTLITDLSPSHRSPCERKQPTHKCPNGPCCPENNESKYCSGKSSPNKPDPNAPSNGCPNVSNETTDAYTGKGAVHDWSSSTNSNSAEVDEKSPRRLVQPPPSGRANFERFAGDGCSKFRLHN